MPIFNVYQINEIHLAKVRTQRANSVMGNWNTEGVQPNPFKLTFKEWKRYVKETLTSRNTPSYISTTIVHVVE
jgi:hypothetical protein